MFYEWVAVGAIFGIKAFFAIFMFGVCVSVILGFMFILAALGQRMTDKNDKKHGGNR